MNKVYEAHKIFNEYFDKNKIYNEVFRSDENRVLFVYPACKLPESVQKATQTIIETKAINGGTLIIISEKKLDKLQLDPIIAEATHKYNKLYLALTEALDGIAVPDDMTQPGRGTSILKKAMSEPDDRGITLQAALAKAGVKMSVAGPGDHMVIFTRNGEEVWRVEPMTLSSKKVLEQTLSALWSISQGKAPNARQMEIDKVKEQAAKAREAEKALSTVAQKYTDGPEEEEQVDATR